MSDKPEEEKDVRKKDSSKTLRFKAAEYHKPPDDDDYIPPQPIFQSEQLPDDGEQTGKE